MRKKIGITALAVAALALASVPAAAVAGKGGGSGGGGNLQLSSFSISGQGSGWLKFSLSTAKPTSTSLGVESICYDEWSQPMWEGYADVDWNSNTLGSAGPMAPPSGATCFAWVHTEGSEKALDGGTLSYNAP